MNIPQAEFKEIDIQKQYKWKKIVRNHANSENLTPPPKTLEMQKKTGKISTYNYNRHYRHKDLSRVISYRSKHDKIR